MSGTIKKVSIVNGSYYLENLYEGFKNPQGADPSAPNDFLLPPNLRLQ